MAILFIIGRILFGGFFLRSAYFHLFKTNNYVGYSAFKKVPFPKTSVIGSGILLLIGGLSMILGVYTIIGAIALVIFLVFVTIKMHAFWKETDPQKKMSEQVQFYKNAALLGAVLMTFAISSPWIYSF